MALEVHQQNHSDPHREDGGVALDSSLARLRRFIPVTLDLFRSEVASSPIELDEPSPLPFGWEKFLDLKTGLIHYSKMSRTGRNTKLDLRLNLLPPRVNLRRPESPNRSLSPSPSPPSSCISSDHNSGPDTDTPVYSNSPEATSMVLVGCPRCLMYVMLSEEDPKCPKCKSTVLLDFLRDNNTKNTKKA